MCISSSVVDKNLTNVGLDVGTNQGAEKNWEDRSSDNSPQS